MQVAPVLVLAPAPDPEPLRLVFEPADGRR
jgi:hypothetical protein